MDIEKIEKLLNVKIVSTEEIRGERVFPLFDLIEVNGVKMTLIKDPVFVVINGEDINEKRIEGEYVVVQKDDKTFTLMKYEGVPNIEMLRAADVEAGQNDEDTTNGKEADEEQEEVANDESTGEEQEEADGEEQEREEEAGEEEEQGKDVIKEILGALPKWADGATVIEKDGHTVVLPIKKSAKGEGYYASLTWRPLNVNSNVEELVGHAVLRSGKVIGVHVRIGDKYVNVYTPRSRGGGSFKRRTYGR